MFLDLERLRPFVFHRIAKPVQRTDTGIAAPRENQLVGTAHADQLVIDDIGRHPHQCQMFALLPDHLVPCGMGDEMGKAFHGHPVPVMDAKGYRIPQRHHFSHLTTSRRSQFLSRMPIKT